MTAFEFVFALLAIVSSLGLTHLVAAFIALIRHAERVRWSAVHALWMWAALTLTIGNWGSYWPLRNVTAWSPYLVLVSVIMTIGQYAFCALVAPETPPTGEIDLRGFHDREHRRYAAALLALCVLAVVQNLMLMSAYANWIRDSISSFELAAIGVLALVVRRGRVQLCAAAALALSTTWFMILSCAITPR